MSGGGESDPSGRTREKVYVVDGDPEVGRSLRLLLSTLHLDVEVFENGEAALPVILRAPPCCLIAEAFLPGMSGLELQRELNARGVQVPIIMLATHADVALAVEAMRGGAADFIEKPVISRAVLARVREAMVRAPAKQSETEPRSAIDG